MNAQSQFIEASNDRYATRAAADRDAELLAIIAAKIATFVTDIEADFRRLDTAREVPVGGFRFERSRWDAEALTVGFADLCGDLLLARDAAKLLSDLAKVEGA